MAVNRRLGNMSFNNTTSTGVVKTVTNGNSKITGTDENNALLGAAGNDTIYAGGGNDQINAGNGQNKLYGEAGNDQITSGNGKDTLDGGTGNDRLTAGNGTDVLMGGDGNDRLYGENGQDTLTGGSGNDMLFGGLANDTYINAANFGADTINDEGGGNDELDLSVFNLADVVSWQALDGNDADSFIEDLLIDMGNGNTVLIQDFFDNSSAYADTSQTGTGNIENIRFSDTSLRFDDIQAILPPTPTPAPTPSEPYCEIHGELTEADIDGTESNNSITGGATNDQIHGLAGNDTLTGAGGNDLICGASGDDTYTFNNGSGIDTVTDNSGIDTVNFSGRTDNLVIDLTAGTVCKTEMVEAVKVGSETLVNTYTNNLQNYPSVTVLSDGGFILVWNSYSSGLPQLEGCDIKGQRYDSSGNQIGSEFRVNSDYNNDQSDPNVASLTDGGFVVTWSGHGDTFGDGYGAFGQRYDCFGNAVGSQFIVNTPSETTECSTKVIGLDDGGFVVVYRMGGQELQNSTDIFGKRYDSLGNAVGSEFTINTYITDGQGEPSIANLSDGGFVVTWSSYGQDGSNFGIYGQCFNSLGIRVGSEFRINTYTTDHQYQQSVTALSNGGFIVTWASGSQDGNGFGVYAQRYDSSGNTLGNEFRVNTFTNSTQEGPCVTSLSNGGFVITWSGAGNGDDYGIFGQLYNIEGNTVGSEFRINTNTNSWQIQVSVKGLSDGGFLVAWSSHDNHPDQNIKYQRFDVNGNMVQIVTMPANEIENAIGSSVNDEIIGNYLNNSLEGSGGNDSMTGGSGNDTLSDTSGNDYYHTFSGTFGSDVINDQAGTGDKLHLGNYNLANVVSWQATDGSDGDAFVEHLVLNFSGGNSITIQNYFNNTTTDDDTSGAGTGLIETIVFADDPVVDFAQVQGLIA